MGKRKYQAINLTNKMAAVRSVRKTQKSVIARSTARFEIIRFPPREVYENIPKTTIGIVHVGIVVH
jgi:hypothetical protein